MLRPANRSSVPELMNSHRLRDSILSEQAEDISSKYSSGWSCVGLLGTKLELSVSTSRSTVARRFVYS